MANSWEPWSPDLSVLDFSIWPIIKSRVFQHPRPATVDELEGKILAVIQEINNDPDLVLRCHRAVWKRAQLCLDNFGSHFEYTK